MEKDKEIIHVSIVTDCLGPNKFINFSPLVIAYNM